MNIKEKIRERVDLFQDAIKLEKEPSRVPIISNVWNWKQYDAGFGMTESMYDFKKQLLSTENHCRNYAIDTIFMDTITRNPMPFTSVLGSDKAYTLDDAVWSVNLRDNTSYFDEEDYPSLIENPLKFIWEVFLPRKCVNLKTSHSGKVWGDAVTAFTSLGMSSGKVGKIMGKYGMPQCASLNCPIHSNNGFEILFGNMRGIKGMALDMRRDPEKVLAACQALDSVYGPHPENYNDHGHDYTYAIDGVSVMIGSSFLSPKQFEKFYWPYLKKDAETLEKFDKTMIYFAEGNSERFYDFFRELPKGRIVILTEQNDIFKMKKALPNICVAGGMPVELLGNGSVQDCTDYAKKLVDELAPGGGYIFSASKMMMFPNDCKRENLKATYEVVRDYRR